MLNHSSLLVLFVFQVVQVLATDPDLGPSGEVAYDFADSKTKVFAL